MEGAAKLGSTVISIPLTMSKNDPVRRQGYHLLHGSVQPLSIPPISQPHVARHSAKRIKRAAKPDEPPHPTRADLVGFEILDQVGQDQGLAGMMEEIHLGDAVAANYPCFQLMAPRPGGVVIECNEGVIDARSEEHTSELQSLMRISYAVFCLKKKIHKKTQVNR